MKYRTALYDVRGLGSAKDGTRHWWIQRITALALVPLTLWLAYCLARIASMGYEQALVWVRSPLTSVLLLSTILALAYHAKLGLQVVIEDYVHREGVKLAALIGVNFLTLLLGLASALAVLRVALAG
jgi:succinate dehydrogenase / fumarate reductase membrane anchor subunit